MQWTKRTSRVGELLGVGKKGWNGMVSLVAPRTVVVAVWSMEEEE